MIPTTHIGHAFEPFCVEIEKGQLLLFAKATGETSPLYTNEVAAREAGYPSILMPPTFPFCAMSIAQPFEVLQAFGVDLAKVLHGEQAFTYHATVFAGDELTGNSRIRDVYTKKDGALEFIVLDTEYFVGQKMVCQSTQTLIVRH